MIFYDYKDRRREIICATGFAVFLAAFVILTISVSLYSAGPMILGTEMNTNGSVEYLCLGRGCENLRPMDY